MVSNMNESMGNLSVHKYLLVKNPRFASQPLFEHMGVTDNLWNAAKVDVPTYNADRFVVSNFTKATNQNCALIKKLQRQFD